MLPLFASSGYEETKDKVLSQAAIDAIAAAVWEKELPLSDGAPLAYGTMTLLPSDVSAIAHAVWARSLP